jgi:transcriptional antiterminator RfaH
MDHTGDQEINRSNWVVVYTKPREELRAQKELINQGLEVFLPLVAAPRRRPSHSDAISYEPLFARYLFVKVNFQKFAFTTLRSTRGVSSILHSSVSGKALTIPASIIYEIQAVINNWQPKPLHQVGDRVRVTSGPAIGVEGLISKIQLSASGEERAWVLIDFLVKPQVWSLPTQNLETI